MGSTAGSNVSVTAGSIRSAVTASVARKSQVAQYGSRRRAGSSGGYPSKIVVSSQVKPGRMSAPSSEVSTVRVAIRRGTCSGRRVCGHSAPRRGHVNGTVWDRIAAPHATTRLDAASDKALFGSVVFAAPEIGFERGFESGDNGWGAPGAAAFEPLSAFSVMSARWAIFGVGVRVSGS